MPQIDRKWHLSLIAAWMLTTLCAGLAGLWGLHLTLRVQEGDPEAGSPFLLFHPVLLGLTAFAGWAGWWMASF